MNSIKVLLSLAANLEWSLLKLDIKNVFLPGESEEVHMPPPFPTAPPAPSLPKPGFEEMYGNGKVCKLKSNHLKPSLKDSHDLLSNMGTVKVKATTPGFLNTLRMERYLFF